jgi:hypothetical protein
MTKALYPRKAGFMRRLIGIGRNAPSIRTFAGLCLLGIAAVACSSSPTRSGTGGSDNGDTGGSTGSTGGTTGTGGATNPTGGSGGSATGGDTGTGGSSSTGGSSGGTPDADVADTATSPPADASGPSADNPCFTKMIDNSRSLPGLSAKDFCDGYEKYCMYTPDGKLMSKCGPGQPVGPLYKDRMDCETKYMAASASARACRAGQMCRNGKDGTALGADTPKGMSLIVNACSHATGYCAGACK